MALFGFLRPMTGGVEYIIAGLGNPGREYDNSRHNAGFIALDHICSKLGVKCDRAKFHALCSQTVINGKKILLMKPQTFMNNSGVSVEEAANFYKVPPQNILVLCDDISLAPGKIRIRRKGSDGGQRGLKSIIGCVGTEDIPRIKIGIGDRPDREYDLADWVLSKFPDDDKKAIQSRLDDVYNAAELIISGDCEMAMNLYNS